MKKTGYLSEEYGMGSEKVSAAEVSLLRAIGNCPNHVLRSILPPLVEQTYDLRLDPTITNCPNVMIAISSIEFCSICSGPNHDSSCIRKNRVNFLKINILIFSPKFQKYGCDYLVFRNCGVSALFSNKRILVISITYYFVYKITKLSIHLSCCSLI